ncbi:MAG TPA: aminodeoxychorismate/anthranilate synthase component II, partial [Bacteroidia bacterium]|nr:aminodeoxychorismate/anthranilate synthase component II [Bacteroidia bacterium]
MRILLLDNYDSFTFNLLHLLEQAENVEVDVVRNDTIVIEEVNKYDGVVLSPGPGLPKEAGKMMD